MRALESRLGLGLLTRTTRSVAPTEAGERLLDARRPEVRGIQTELAALNALRDKPWGNIRITRPHAAETILWPKLAELLQKYPELHVEIIVDYGFTDIVADRL